MYIFVYQDIFAEEQNGEAIRDWGEYFGDLVGDKE